MPFKDKLQLRAGETLANRRDRTKGTMGQTEIEEYDILNTAKEVVGRVKYTAATALRGLKTTHHVEQHDATGRLIVEDRW